MNVDQVFKLSGKWFSNKTSDNLSYLVQFHLEWVTLKIPWNDSTNISFPFSVEMFPNKQDIMVLFFLMVNIIAQQKHDSLLAIGKNYVYGPVYKIRH